MFNLSNYVISNTTRDCEEIQLDICSQYSSNITTPLVVAIVLLLIRWFLIYKLKDKESRLFRYGEIITDVGVFLLILVSLIWRML